VLNGKITRSELGEDLLTTIDSVADVGGQLQGIGKQLGTLQGDVDHISGIVSEFDPVLAGDDNVMAGDDTVLVGVWTEQSAREEGDMVLGQRIDAVEAVSGNASAAVKQ
jgi:hypothetical protein